MMKAPSYAIDGDFGHFKHLVSNFWSSAVLYASYAFIIILSPSF